jgi:hypothetical protein
MFIFLERDTFEAKSKGIGSDIQTAQSGDDKGKAPIRRPYRGIQIKNDTYAVLSVRHADGNAIPLASSSAVVSAGVAGGMGQVDEYSDFILQQVTDQRMEKQQIIETFGDSFVYFFGERPRMLTFTGQLMNTEDFNWRAQFWYNYDKFLRGSKLVQANARCYLAYDTIVIEGYPLSATAIDDAENPYQVSFQMTMLMTDYHEYSIIGETRFPAGPTSKSLEILNQELEEQRRGFVSTSAEVRRANLEASTSQQLPGSGGALSVIRKGISAMNSATSWLGDKLQTVNDLLGGRAMRIPIGAASFLQLTQEAEIAPASITTSSSVGFDAATGELYGTIKVNNNVIPGNKLLIMGPSKFAPTWKSEVSGMPPGRGYIFENYDEYPLQQEPSLKKMMGDSQYESFMAADQRRVANMTAFQQSLSLYNVFAAQGGVLGAVASVVSTVRQGYGMVLTSANVIRDPVGMMGGALGVTPQDIKRIGEGLKDGAFVPGVRMFVGGAARSTWASWVSDVSNRYSSLGAVFNGFEYQSTSAEDLAKKAYEAVYGNADYSPLLKARSAAAAALTAATGQVVEDVATIEKTLDEVFGNTDSASYGENQEDQAALEEVYGQEGTIQKTTPTAEERAAMLNEAYNGDAPPTDTDVSGITAADADSAPIAPVV